MAFFLKLMGRQRHGWTVTHHTQTDWNWRWISLHWWCRGPGKQLSCLHLDLCSPGTNQRTSGFCSNTYLNCKPVQTFTTNISSQNTAMGMLILLKMQRPNVLATYVPQAPSRSQTYFSCPRSQAVFAKTSQRACFSRVISRNTKLQDTEVPAQDQLRTWSQNYSTQRAHYTSHSCTLYCQSQGLKSHKCTLLQK